MSRACHINSGKREYCFKSENLCHTKCFILGSISACYEGKLQTRDVY